jgi:signal transduction histidine kinase/putative methionine-R-sulfoxide reductase with GAF domain
VVDASPHADLELLAEQQGALRRLATLVAEGSAAAELYSAVVDEAALVLDISAVILARYEPDGTATVLASLNEPTFPVGSNWPIDGPSVTAAVRDTGRPARVDDYSRLPGSIAANVRDSSIRSTVGVPIRVDGEVWGLLTVASDEVASLSADTEDRLTDFAALVATGISNASSHDRLQRVLAQQAALRRVATLVARESSAVEVFSAVTDEALGVLDTEAVGLLRLEPDGSVSLVAQSDTPWDPPPLGTRLALDGVNVIVQAVRTGQAVRVDDWADATGSVAEMATVLGVRSCVATPITVDGRLWGVMVTATSRNEPLPADTRARTEQFTELIATAIANAESRQALGVLADEQAALRRVAVLVAEQPSPDEVFTAVTEAVAPLLGADLTAMHAFTDDGTATTIAGWSAKGPMLPLGMRLPLDGDSAAARIFRTGAAARIDSYLVAEGETADVARGLGLRSTVGAPIFVEGRLWGALMAATRRGDPLPHDAETRIAAFTELVATAVSNADSRAALGLLADEQASLRRVATLVAEGVPPADVFAAVSREVEHVFALRTDITATVVRFDSGPECVLVGASKPIPETPLGTRWQPNDLYVSTRVLKTAASSRVDEADLAVGGFAAEQMRRQGYLSQVASPIVVEGRLWGAMTVSAGRTLPSDVAARLEKFTELIATAIANAESQSELAASRRRMVAAADDARRRIERDLHDGIQQQLVSLGMELGAVEASLPPDDELAAQVAAVSGGLRRAIDDLREVSRGIHPAILAHGGLAAALKTLARRSPVPVQLSTTVDGRLSERVEVAAYYVVSEALTNVARHSGATVANIDVTALDGTLEVSIRDDGAGGADERGGTGLIGLKDRVEALGGRLSVESPRGRGTSLFVTLPLAGEGPLGIDV